MAAHIRPPTDTERVILAFCAVLLGDGRKDRGLMSHIVRGRRHLERCQIGMYVTPESRLTNGEPCSQRCRRAHHALDLAECWLKRRASRRRRRVVVIGRRPKLAAVTQMALPEAV